MTKNDGKLRVEAKHRNCDKLVNKNFLTITKFKRFKVEHAMGLI